MYASWVGDSETSAEHRPVANPPVLRGLLQEQPSLEESPTLSFATFALVSFEFSQTPGMSLAWAPLYVLSVPGESSHWEAACSHRSFNLRFWWIY